MAYTAGIVLVIYAEKIIAEKKLQKGMSNPYNLTEQHSTF